MSSRAEISQNEDEFETSGQLGDDIASLFCTSNFDGSDRDYLPEGCLDSLITAKSIKCELDKFTQDLHRLKTEDSRRKTREMYTDDFRQELGRWIQNNAPRTFATMVHCGLGPLYLLMSMQKCRETKFDDHKLPIPTPDSLPESWNTSIWPRHKLRDFYDKQWKFLAPVFLKDKYHYDCKKNCIFPFTRENVPPRYGAFSTVYKVTVHEKHQKHDFMQAVSYLACFIVNSVA